MQINITTLFMTENIQLQITDLKTFSGMISMKYQNLQMVQKQVIWKTAGKCLKTELFLKV